MFKQYIVQVDTFGKTVEEAGIGYLYKNVLPISMLGLVDDVVGVTDTGYKAQQLNVILNDNNSWQAKLSFFSPKCLKLGV